MFHYHQGDLDSFCGVYAIINAVTLLCELDHHQARELFRHVLICLNSQGNKEPITERLSDGLKFHDVTCIINKVVCKDYPITRYKPFHKKRNVDLDQYWNTLQAELNQPNSLAFIGIGGHFNHWTLIQRITSKSLILKDSIGMRYLNRRYCTVSKDLNIKKRYWLYPNNTYILKVK